MYFKEQVMDINRNNYETFFLLYLDRELNPSEMSEVEKFVNENADLQKEFSLLSQTILVPAQTIFDQKELLFRKEDKRRVIPMYWTRIAAAVAVLVFGSWLITTQLGRKSEGESAGSDGKKNMVAVNKNSSDQKTKEAIGNTAEKSDAVSDKIQPAVDQNTTATQNQSPANSGIVKKRTKPENDLSGRNNQDQSLVTANPDLRNTSGEIADGSILAMQKSSVQELQPVDSQKDADPKQISALPGTHSAALVIAANGSAENVPHMRDENAVFVENEDQTDNAISVVALNDKNKGITKLFKKLTRRTPADENARKVRLSVFQFSY